MVNRGGIRRAVPLLVSLVLIWSCGKEGKSTTQADPVAPVPLPKTLQLTTPLARLTPEQFSRLLKDRLHIESGWQNQEGAFQDAIVKIFGVSLGGVDFKSTFFRDPSPKVQTILVTRALAWQLASTFVWWESDPVGAGKTDRQPIMTQVRIKEDFPAQASALFPGVRDVAERDSRWKKQFIDIYWRLFARAPTEEEISLCANAFADVLREQRWPPMGWQIVMFSLMSSAEFWNIWGAP